MAAFTGKAVRRFFQDEARLGLHESATRRRLTARGVKPLQPMLPRYEYFWLYGAVDPSTGDSLFLELPALDTPCFQAFLHEFSLAFPDTLNVLVLDGAPPHTAHALEMPENVLLFRLPPYCPELNPVERIWLDVRKCLGSGLPASLQALAGSAAEAISSYTPETLMSLTHFGYQHVL
ncbi:MAG TPA: transposase, partial [Longimicrobium sp.]|nr:transposase [Longimicrobium sp.]